MPTSWTARYFDGQTAARHRISITVTPEALLLLLSSGEIKEWPYEQIRQTQDAYSGEPLRLEYGAEAVVLPTPTLLSVIHQTATINVRHFHNPSRRKGRMRRTVCAALGILFMVAGLYGWGIPGMAAVLTPYVPLAWEDQLGQQVIEHLAPEGRQCHDSDRLRKLDQVVQALTKTQPASPYRIRLSVVDAPEINAFAAPGGRVVILRGLLEKTASPDQLAGVLAHELQHVYQRHTTRAILERSVMTFLLTAISGDLSSGLAWGLEGAHALRALHYSRTHEREADREGLRMLEAAHLDPAAMIAFYRIMQNGAQSPARPPEFLSTHPDVQERLATLISLAGPPPANVVTLLPGENWQDIRTLCRLRTDSRAAPVSF